MRVKFLTGFTLIELLVVIAIIGMLAGIVLVSMGGFRARGRDGRRQADLRQIMTAMELCYGDASCGEGLDEYSSTTAGINTVTQIGNYLVVPCDPSGCQRGYNWTDNAPFYKYYCVYAKLEVETNTWICASNKGLQKKTLGGYTPTNDDCCGPNVTI